MTRENEARTDINRLLALTWRSWGKMAVDPDTITRTWSLDLGWMSPSDAEKLLSRLVGKGWLTTEGDGLVPTNHPEEISIPLGWFPRQTILSNPPLAPTVEQPTNDVAEEKVEALVETIESSTSKISEDIPALLNHISVETGLARKEVMRRAQSKKRTLGHVTTWMCLCLVARELGLSVDGLASA